MKFDYVEIGSSCFKTLAEVFKDDDSIVGLTVEPVPQYLDIIRSYCSKSINKHFFRCAVTKETEESISFYFIDPLKVKRWAAVGIAGIGCVSEARLKKTIKSGAPEFDLNTDQIREIETPSLSFKDLVAKFDIDDIDVLKIDAEGCDFEILLAMLETNVRPSIVIFEARPFMSDDQIQEINIALDSEGYSVSDMDVSIARPHGHKGRNFFCLRSDVEALFFYEHASKMKPFNVMREFRKKIVYKNKNTWIKEIQKTQNDF